MDVGTGNYAHCGRAFANLFDVYGWRSVFACANCGDLSGAAQRLFYAPLPV
ncbi:hypothetical protein D3C85_1757720 [compost metagenome]